MRRTILSVDLLALDMARPILLALSLALGVALLVAQFWIGLGALLAIGLALRQAGLPRGERHARVELILPVVLLAGPALLFRAHSWPTPRMLRIFSSSPDAPAELRDLLRAEPVTPDLVTSAGLAASCLIAATLALTLLLLQLRDREADRLDRVHTTASQLSAPGAAALAWAWSLGVMLLAAMGAGAGWWHWGAALLAAWTGAASMALVTAGVRGYAAGVGFAGYAAMSLLIAISTV